MSEPDHRARWETRTVEEAVHHYRTMARDNYNWMWAHEMFEAANYIARMAGLPEEDKPPLPTTRPRIEVPPPPRRPTASAAALPVTAAETASTPPLRRKPPPPAETPVSAVPSLFNIRQRR